MIVLWHEAQIKSRLILYFLLGRLVGRHTLGVDPATNPSGYFDLIRLRLDSRQLDWFWVGWKGELSKASMLWAN
jgi:hypothetical protein